MKNPNEKRFQRRTSRETRTRRREELKRERERRVKNRAKKGERATATTTMIALTFFQLNERVNFAIIRLSRELARLQLV